MKRPHSHDAEWAPPAKPDSDLPLFAPRPPITEPAFLAKWLRASALYHRAHGGSIELSTDMCRALARLGVLLELAPRGTLPTEATPDQCERYATELERAA